MVDCSTVLVPQSEKALSYSLVVYREQLTDSETVNKDNKHQYIL